MCRQSATVCLTKSPSRQHREIAGLPARLATLPDPRDRRGRRHPFVAVLLVACSAVVAGARSFAAIGQWARNTPQDALARLGARTVTVFGVRLAPSAATIRRLVNRTCPGGLADLLGADPAGADTLSVFSVATHRVTTSPPATDKAPTPLREVFDVSTHWHRSLVGSLSCRTRPASCPGRVGNHAHRHPRG
jgi:hypothetical protein